MLSLTIHEYPTAEDALLFTLQCSIEYPLELKFRGARCKSFKFGSAAASAEPRANQRRKIAGAMDDSAVPAAALEALRQTETSLADLSDNLAQFLSMADADALAEMPPLHRARAFIVLARTASELLSVRLRCSGIRPDDHPIKTELERLSLHEAKLDRFVGRSKEPLRPSTTINYQAATRVIRHSLPDLTPEQRQDLRKISGREGVRSRFTENDGSRKRRKRQDTEKQSVRAAAQDFLEKASRELLGSNERGMKGPYPLREESSDEGDAMRS